MLGWFTCVVPYESSHGCALCTVVFLLDKLTCTFCLTFKILRVRKVEMYLTSCKLLKPIQSQI